MHNLYIVYIRELLYKESHIYMLLYSNFYIITNIDIYIQDMYMYVFMYGLK